MEQGALVASKYRLLRVLGQGAMGVVWAARNVMTDRTVALKLIPKDAAGSTELRSRMLREALACGRIQHRNVVEIYDVGQTDDGAPFLVMQLLRGETLAHRLRRDGPLVGEELASVALSIARALAAAHAAGIVHRDLKPANIFLHREPSERTAIVKVLDFGVSKLLVADPREATVTGSVIGSPAYMSPEQARGASSLEPRSDVWAFGAVLFELVTGRIAFPGDTAYEAVAEILHGELPTLGDDEVDPRIAAIVRACLQRDAKARPTSAAIVDALEAASEGGDQRCRPSGAVGAFEARIPLRLASSSATSTTPALRESASPVVARGRRTLVVVTAALIVGCLAVAGMMRRGPRPTSPPAEPPQTQASASAIPPSGAAPIASTHAPPFSAPAEGAVSTSGPGMAARPPTKRTPKPPPTTSTLGKPSKPPPGPVIPLSPG